MALNLGGVIRLTNAVKNDLGVLTNPGAATLSITQPDGVIATPLVTLPPVVTGQLVVDFAPTQAGLHSVHWATTVPVTSEDDVFVAERPAVMLVSVDEAVAHLRAGGIITSDADREQLQWLCIVATDAVERDLNLAIVRREVTETFDGGDYELNLHTKPPRHSDGGSIIDITVTESGVSITDFGLKKNRWRLVRGGSLWRTRWALGWDNISVTYSPGCANPPSVTRHVALNVLQIMWQASQQAGHPLLDETSTRIEIPTSILPSLSDVEANAYRSLKSVNYA